MEDAESSAPPTSASSPDIRRAQPAADKPRTQPVGVPDTEGSGQYGRPGASPSPTEPSSTPCLRVPSVTPPKPPPPYSYGPHNDVEMVEASDLSSVRNQLAQHFKKTGIEGVAMKYEAAIVEAAALRRQVHSLKLQLEKGEQLAASGMPMMMSPVGSPSISPRRLPTFNTPEEEASWNAMNVDVVTKLQAVDKVAKIRQEYEDSLKELRQELVVKEEVLRLLTEQLKGMVEKGQLDKLQDELNDTFDELQVMKRERDIFSEERAELQARVEDLQRRLDEMDGIVDRAKACGAKEVELSLSTEVERLRRLEDESLSYRAEAECELEKLREQLAITKDTLAQAEAQLTEKDRLLAEAEKTQMELAMKEGAVRELADNLQAQSLAHKQMLAESQSREAKLSNMNAQREASREVVTSLQAKLEEREKEALKMAALLEEKNGEVAALQTRLRGFTDHLQSHLREKEDQIRALRDEHAKELDRVRLAASEAESKANVLQALTDNKLSEAKREIASQAALLEEREIAMRKLAIEAETLRAEVERAKKSALESGRDAQEFMERHGKAMRSELTSSLETIARLERSLQERDVLAQQQQNTISELQREILSAEGSTQTVRKQLQLQKQETHSLQQQCDRLSREVDQLQKELISNDSIAKGTQQTLDEARQKSCALIAKLQEQVANVERRCREQASRHAEEMESISARFRSELDVRDEELQKRNDQIMLIEQRHAAEKAEAQDEIQRTKGSLSWIAQTLDDVELKLKDRDETIRLFQQAAKKKDEEIASLRALLQKSGDTLDRLQASAQHVADDSQRKMAELGEELLKCEKMKASLTMELADANSTIEGLKTQLARDRESAATKIADTRAEAAVLGSDLQLERSKLEVEEEARRNAERKLDEAMRAMTEQMALREAKDKQLQQTVTESKEMATQISELTEQVEQLKVALEEKEVTTDAMKEEECRQGELVEILKDRLHDAVQQQDALQRELGERTMAFGRLQEEMDLEMLRRDEALHFKYIAMEEVYAREMVQRRSQITKLEEAAVTRVMEMEQRDEEARRLAMETQQAEEEARTRLAEKVAALEGQLAQQAEEFEKALTNAEERRLSEVVKLESAVGALTEQTGTLEELKEELLEKDKKVEKLKREVMEAGLRVEDERRRLRNALEEREMDVADKDAEVRRLAEEKAELENAVANKERLLLELSCKMDSRSADVRSLHEALEETVKQVRDLREQLSRRNAEVSEQAQELAVLRKERHSLQETQSSSAMLAQAKIADLEGNLAAITAASEEKGTQLSRLQRHVTELEEALAQGRRTRESLETNLISVKGELEAKRVALQEVNSGRSQHAAQVESLQRAMCEREERLRERIAECDKLREERDATAGKLDELHSQLREKAARLNDMASQLEAKEAGLAKVEAELRESQAMLRRAEDSHVTVLTRAERRIELLQEQILAHAAREQELEERFAREIDGKGQDTERITTQLRRDLAAKDEMIQRLRDSVEAARSKTGAPVEQVARAEQALQELTREVQRLRSQLGEKEELARQWEAKYSQKESEARTLQTALADEVNRVERLNERIMDMHGQIAERISLFDACCDRLREVRRVCETFCQKYRDLEAAMCSPYITPQAEGWNEDLAASFIRAAKQYCIDYTTVVAGSSSPTGMKSVSPPRPSPPRGVSLVRPDDLRGASVSTDGGTVKSRSVSHSRSPTAEPAPSPAPPGSTSLPSKRPAESKTRPSRGFSARTTGRSAAGPPPPAAKKPVTTSTRAPAAVRTTSVGAARRR